MSNCYRAVTGWRFIDKISKALGGIKGITDVNIHLNCNEFVKIQLTIELFDNTELNEETENLFKEYQVFELANSNNDDGVITLKSIDEEITVLLKKD